MGEVDGWRSDMVDGVEIETFVPEGPVAAAIFLHGADQQSFRGRGPFEGALSEQRLLAVCPRDVPGWWLDVPAPGTKRNGTPMAFVRDRLTAWMAERWGFAPPRIGLCGLGSGGQGALNLAFRHARQFPVVAAISPDVDFHQWHGLGTPLDRMFPSREAARQQTATLHLHPLNWPPRMLIMCAPEDHAAFEGTERLLSKLNSTGIPYEVDVTTSRGGDQWGYFDLMIPRMVKFLGEALRG